MPRPKTYDAADRMRILDHAATVIARDGVAGLSLRALATDTGVSTTAIYSLIGGKDDIVAAVAAEASRSFTAAQRAVVDGRHAVQDLTRLGIAYRAWAIAHPSLYAILFRGLVPGPRTEAARPDAFAPLLQVVTRLAHEGGLRGDDPHGAALAIWAAVHGAVSLELELWPHQEEAVSAEQFETTLDAVARAWLV